MYVLDYQRQIALMQEMTQLRKNDDKWEVYYHHPSTNEMWKSYFPRANGEKRGPKILRTEPVPEDMTERMNLCLKSNDEDDAVGLAIELSVKPDKWETIVEVVEKHFKEYDRSHLKLFFKHLCLLTYEDLFEELHYEPAQFDMDESDFKQLRWRARKVLLKKIWFFW